MEGELRLTEKDMCAAMADYIREHLQEGLLVYVSSVSQDIEDQGAFTIVFKVMRPYTEPQYEEGDPRGG